ncbi:MAG: ABC transporter ATP-binding protein [Candidatus Aminicenantes bacterium]|nr:ABC transporter ATP-binding protein [Candidatus Aminicenantes bacterium]NLH77545.1 ABC transporter ATP-binding protein [Acidobacteriota bacterium]
MPGNVIELRNLVKTYCVGETEVRALRGVSYNIGQGDFLAIMGPSGSGKSSLMNILGCLDRPTSGEYFLEGEDVAKLDKDRLARIRNQKIGFVFQSFNLLSRTTALENVELPLYYSTVAESQNMTGRALAALEAVGLKDRAHHKTNQLSGGEQQRVAIARALLNNPTLILADEPTGNLDSRTSSEVMNIFKSLNEDKGITMVMVTHEPDIAAWAGKRIYLKDGLIVREETS